MTCINLIKILKLNEHLTIYAERKLILSEIIRNHRSKITCGRRPVPLEGRSYRPVPDRPSPSASPPAAVSFPCSTRQYTECYRSCTAPLPSVSPFRPPSECSGLDCWRTRSSAPALRFLPAGCRGFPAYPAYGTKIIQAHTQVATKSNGSNDSNRKIGRVGAKN